VLWLWWLALHVLLASTALSVGWPWLPKVAAIVALVAHAVWRRPLSVRSVIEVGADGACRIPGISAEPFAPTSRTRLAPFWVRVVARNEGDAVDILLVADQLDSRDWRRLIAILRRAIAR
jgi:hypothetical protein